MKLNLFADTYVVCKLQDDAELVKWFDQDRMPMLTLVTDGHGKTVVCPKRSANQAGFTNDIKCQTEWRCFQVDGILDFEMIGIIAGLTAVLEKANISVYVISSFETDYLMVMTEYVEKAVEAFENDGHIVERVPANN